MPANYSDNVSREIITMDHVKSIFITPKIATLATHFIVDAVQFSIKEQSNKRKSYPKNIHVCVSRFGIL
jgi:hypothetical protein